MDYDYTEDPFAGDDDDLCYAEIIIPSDANTPQQQVTPPSQRAGGSRRVSMTRHADPYAGYSTPNASEMLRDVASRPQPRGDSVPAAPNPVQRQRAGSQQRQTVTSRSEEESVRGSVAAADPEQLAATYEDMLQSLRGEVDRLQEENNTTYSSQSKLESQLRKMTLDKEDMEWRYQQAQERNALLEERIRAMEQDLAYAQGERREQRQLEAHQARVEASAASTPAARSTRAPPPPQPQQQPQQQQQERQQQPAPLTAQALIQSQAPEQPAQHMRAKPSPPPFATSAPEPSATKRTAAQTAKLTEKQKDHEYQSGIQSVEKLEAELLEHSQKRDELMGTIQRLERVRTIADRAKKAAAENDLEEEDRVIGHIRLQLRSKAFLHR